jgi:hypothetical protein
MYNILMAKPEGKQPLGRPRRRWEDGIRMDLREFGWGSVEWIQLAEDRNRSFLYQQDIKAYGGIKAKIHVFLTSALSGSEWSASSSDRYILMSI